MRINNINLLGMSLIVSSLTACGPGMKVNSEDLAKVKSPGATPIFKEAAATTSNSSQSTGNGGEETPPPEVPKTIVSFKSFNLCSNAYTQSVGSNIMQSTDGVMAEITKLEKSANGRNSTLKVVDVNQNGVENRNSLINSKKISLDVTGLPLGKYYVELKDKKSGVVVSGKYSFSVVGGNKVENITRESSQFASIGTADRSAMVVLYNINSSGSKAAPTAPKNCGAEEGQTPCPPPTEECDQRASPLMVDTESSIDRSRFIMSSPLEGVKFDILGTGVANQISWPTQPARARFLVLPNANGLVESVDELFGDNTVGPDGKGAANGFEALRKYDLNTDGVIDRFDSVFSDLRLWADLNRNGKVDSGELVSLNEKGLTSINLNYQQILDEDAFGNQTRQRSTVQTADGLLRMIVDIWFRPAF